MAARTTDLDSTESFVAAEFACEVAGSLDLVDGVATALEVSDPAHAIETIHWGRNYLYSVGLRTTEGSVAAVVKLFRNQGWRRRLERRLKGSKAQRSWSMARALQASGISTPDPLMLLESEAPDGPSILVTRQVDGFVEARYLFRALKGSTLATDYPWLDAKTFARSVAASARAMHDAGFWHRDFSIGNLLISRLPGDEGIHIDVVDLNRMRQKGSVSVSQRSRDLSRLGFYDEGLDRLFLEAYWQGRTSGSGWKRALYRFYRSAYLLRVEGKKSFRGLFGGLRQKLFLRQPYAHIPLPEENADKRDKSVWDGLSDQPHQHASRSERLRVRLADLGTHVRAFSSAALAVPRIRRRYASLKRELWSRQVPWPGVGIGIGPESGDVEEMLVAIDDLGVEQVLLRLHPWDQDQRGQVELARALFERGLDLTFAMPQVRALVSDLERWGSVVRELGEALIPYGNRFQIGQAINRSKWGLWNYGEYVDLLATAERELRALGEVEIMGPGVIDFEPHAMAAALNLSSPSRLDMISSMLYVDRRGAPENEQLGFDTLGKAAVFRAVGDTARCGADRYWVTEFNWPLWEGPHSPAGRSVSVDEERQADYLVRYCVPLLSSGLAERAYWWQLSARGYGLLDPKPDTDGPARRRPSFHALKTLQAELAGTTAHGPTDLGADVHAYRFTHPERGEALVVWSLEEPVRVELPRAAAVVVSRDGERTVGGGGSIEVSSSPQYLWFGAESS